MKHGIIVIDKPAGISSAKVVSCVKKALGVKKAGHTGTLDPFATGVLVCGINKGTKLSRFFPVGNIMEVAIAITEHPFSVTSPIYDNYMEKTEKRLKVIADTFGEETKFITTDGEKTPEECLAEMINYVKDKNII